MQKKTSKLRKLLRWLPGVLISLIAIYAVLKFINPDDLKSAFSTVKPVFILILFGLDVLGLAVRGKAWQVILGGQVTYKQAFFGICEGYFLNNILPFRAGELGRSYFVGRSSGKGTFYVLSTIVIERGFDILFAAAIVVATLPYVIGMDWIKPIATVALLIVIAVFILLFIVANNKEKVLNWTSKISRPSKIWNFLLPKVHNLVEGFSLLAKPAQFLLSFFWIGATWFTWTVVYYLSTNAVIPGAPFWWGAFVSGIMALGIAIPSAPSALGVYEASFVGALAILGGASSTALAYALTMHLVQFIVSAIFGFWGLLRERISFSQVFSGFESNSTQAESTSKESEES